MNHSTQHDAMTWLWIFTKARRGYYILSVLFALIGVAFHLAPYFFMAGIIEHLMTGHTEWHFYLHQGLIIALLWLARYLFHAISTLLSHHATFLTLADIRKALLRKLARLPLGTVQEQPSGSYKNTIVERVGLIETTLAHIVPEFTANLCGAAAVFLYLMILDWRIGLWSLLTLPVGVLLFAIMMKKMPAWYPQTIEKTKILNNTAVEYINGIEVIKAFGQAKTSYGKFQNAAKEGADCFIEWMRSCVFEHSFGMAILPATLIAILPAGTRYVLNGSLNPSDFVFAIILSFGIVVPLLTVFSYTDDLTQIQQIMGDVAGILNREDLSRPKWAKALPRDAEIVLKDVYFAYGDSDVLHGVNLTIHPGTVNALVGPSGSGKSTIAKLIASLWDVSSGDITMGGVNIKHLPLDVYNRYVAYISQDNYLFDCSVMDNIRMGKAGATDEDVIEAAKACGCHDFIMSLENGYHTLCGDAGGHLSGGERQRIAIARAMLKDSPVVIFDEATSYTDPESEAVVQSALATLMQGKTVLVIAHRLSTIADADQICVIQDGNIVAEGKHEALLSTCELYQSMWQAHRAVRVSEGVAL